MRPKFHQMNEAVEEIRNKVQEVFNNGQMFTRPEGQPDDQYEICCTFSDLRPDSNFPNVSEISLLNKKVLLHLRKILISRDVAALVILFGGEGGRTWDRTLNRISDRVWGAPALARNIGPEVKG